MVTEVTAGIKVTVEVDYRSEFSDPMKHNFLFSYHIKIENLSPYEVKLLSRRWLIFDGVGQYREVVGPGVVGKQPVIPSGEHHAYESACNLTSEMGTMEGHYVMERTVDGAQFEVAIPRFQMETPFKLN